MFDFFKIDHPLGHLVGQNTTVTNKVCAMFKNYEIWLEEIKVILDDSLSLYDKPRFTHPDRLHLCPEKFHTIARKAQ